MVADPPCPGLMGHTSPQDDQINPTQLKYFHRQVFHNCQCPGRPKRLPESSDILFNSSSCEFSNQLSSNFSDKSSGAQVLPHYTENTTSIKTSTSNLQPNCLRLNPHKSNRWRRRSRDGTISSDLSLDTSSDLPQNNTLGKNYKVTTPIHRPKNLLNAVISPFCRALSVRLSSTLSVRQLVPLASSWLLSALLLILVLPNLTEACSSRSTPRPRPISPTLRPNITFQTYACPPAYAAWYCLNGATCFTVKIAESILYNCECSDGFRGQRCEFKDLEGSYHRPGDKVVLQTASLAGSACVIAVLAVFFLISLLTAKNRQNQNSSYQKLEESCSLADGEVTSQLPLTNRDIVRWSSRDLPSYGALLDVKTENNVKSQSSLDIDDEEISLSNSGSQVSADRPVSQEGSEFAALKVVSTQSSKSDIIPLSSSEVGCTSPSQLSGPMSVPGYIHSPSISGNTSPSRSLTGNISPSHRSLSGNISPSHSLSGIIISQSSAFFSPVHQKHTSHAMV